MSVHNEKEEHLRLAVESICKQTYDNIELILIDDASDEECKAVIYSLISKWRQIKLLQNTTNIGLTASLNRALRVASGDYIARMDADDYSTPDRITKQVEFLDRRNEVDICGTGVISFGATQIFMSPHSGLDPKQAQCRLFYSSTLCHPSVMMRKSFLDKHNIEYDEAVLKGQDYDMWERCSVYGNLAVLKEVLLYYRIHNSQISFLNKDQQENSANIVRLRRLGRLGIKPTDREFKCHLALISGKSSEILPKEVNIWTQKLIKANKEKQLVDARTFEIDLDNRFFIFCLKMRKYSVFANIKYWYVFIRIICYRILMSIKLNSHRKIINKLTNNVDL